MTSRNLLLRERLPLCFLQIGKWWGRKREVWLQVGLWHATVGLKPGKPLPIVVPMDQGYLNLEALEDLPYIGWYGIVFCCQRMLDQN